MDGLTVRGICKSFGNIQVLNGVSFSIRQGETAVLHGVSGCGKTTLLQMIAGLQHPDAGEIFRGDTLVSSRDYLYPPHKRGVAFAFQTPALWPHMSVLKNIRFAAGGKSSEAQIRDICDTLQIDDCLKKKPRMLSGGQAKRVELARALSARPKLLLLDEPTAHLDPALRDRTVDFILRYAEDTGIAMLYVTHDEVEAAQISGQRINL